MAAWWLPPSHPLQTIHFGVPPVKKPQIFEKVSQFSLKLMAFRQDQPGHPVICCSGLSLCGSSSRRMRSTPWWTLVVVTGSSALTSTMTWVLLTPATMWCFQWSKSLLATPPSDWVYGCSSMDLLIAHRYCLKPMEFIMLFVCASAHDIF